ncbi:Putative multicopper oxidase, second cupredoxin domain, multicopper oxidase, copper-binding protein [Colletotrichum destructivum]|uniref:Multicopper oxidase, second cupredoxin domain, multicopper oxidase, copper-binding protein n=1 Tax=Colletotrichum destructivum TaxID=34406 RepID=A0AAX4IQU4_9PEZI|nr:Putative multicopper oxidase, second cupredoxin domain, multicopper oxidase, copper-binding protein [Colletotrichum destructivum]
MPAALAVEVVVHSNHAVPGIVALTACGNIFEGWHFSFKPRVSPESFNRSARPSGLATTNVPPRKHRMLNVASRLGCSVNSLEKTCGKMSMKGELCGLFLGLSQTVYANPEAPTVVSKAEPTQTCFPPYLGYRSDGKKSTPPWGKRTCESDPDDVPKTGVTRKYEWTIQRAVLAPDGFEQELLTVNGQFPGPLLEANWGDMVEVTIHNNITGPEEGTAMHWHGIHQQGTGLMDGVSGITQCPIVPGGSFTYRWRASTYGSTWYHGHHALQYGGGLWGPLIIYGPSHVKYDFDLGPVTLSDYYHYPYEKVAQDAISTSTDPNVYAPKSNNHLINGMNNFNCSLAPADKTCTPDAERASLRFKSGKVHKLRLINTSVEAMQIFSIDGHKIIVTMVDFVPVEPYEVEYVILGVGMRAEVLVKGTGDPTQSYYMRTRIQCSATNANQTLGTIYYDETPVSVVPEIKTVAALPILNSTVSCGDPDLLKKKPIYKKSVPKPDMTLLYDITWGVNASGNHQWLMNGVTFLADWSRPLYIEAVDGNAEYLKDPHHIMATIPDDVRHVRVIINNHFSIHPMHIHGGDFQILSESSDYYNGTGTIEYPKNPARADTELLRRYGHLVVQFEAKNPGVWSFHCHTAWHASVGLYINFLVKPKTVAKAKIPDDVREVCRAWDEYKKLNGANATPFDSGLR